MNYKTRQEFPVSTLLPVMIAGAFLALYLLTLGHGVTMSNLGMVAQLSGTDWPQNNLPPVTLLLTLPLRLIPASILPLVVNFLGVVVAVLTLMLLARSVALLPHDRTQAQRDRERSDQSFLTIRAAWLPPVLATMACGLQMTFWENAVDGTGYILNALLLAYPIRCLLEYRVSERESWLYQAALVFGLGMANNWLMVALLPSFLVAVFWIRGLSFFNIGFLGKMFIAGLLGVACLFALPLAQSMGAGSPFTFGEAVKQFFIGQKAVLGLLPLKLAWIFGLTSLLPITLAGIRWASSFGDNSQLGAALAGFMFDLVHGLFLLACLWSAFDGPLSPRAFARQAEIPSYFATQPWLSLYWLGALAVGYYSGYFLLLYDNKVRAARFEGGFKRALNVFVTGILWLLLLLVPLGLAAKNFAHIRSATSSTFGKFGRRLVSTLPQKPAIILADDPRLLMLVQSVLADRHINTPHAFINTTALPVPQYHKFLEQKFPQMWKADVAEAASTNQLNSTQLVPLLLRQSEGHRVYYLHPSFGYYFEAFYAVPRGMIFELQPFTTNQLVAPPLRPEVIATNLNFWKEIDASRFVAVTRNLPPAETNSPSMLENLFHSCGIKIEYDSQAMLVGAYYSRSLNAWGVIAQMQGNLEHAAWCFEQALAVNPLNVTAELNQTVNAILQTGRFEPFEFSPDILSKFGQYRNADQMLGINGPCDDPRIRFARGHLYIQTGNYHQAVAELLRAKELMPDEPGSYIWLGQIYNLWKMPEATLNLIRVARELPAVRTNLPPDLVATEATAHYLMKDVPAAVRVVEAALARSPNNERMANTAVQLFINLKQPTNALEVVERQLQKAPDNLNALNNQSVIFIQLGQYDQAVTVLNRVLKLSPTNSVALLNRAIANLQSGRLDDSRRDYEALAQVFPSAYQINYGLGEIAWRQHDNAEAVRQYQQYITHAPADTDEAQTIQQRLVELQAGTSAP